MSDTTPREATIGYYTSLFSRVPELGRQTDVSPNLIEERLQRYTTDFLDRIKGRVNAFSDDSRSLMLHLIDATSTEAMISEVLAAQEAPALLELGYADIALVFEAVRSYSRDELDTASLEPRKNPKQIAALHHVTHAVRFVKDEAALSEDNSPLEYLHGVIGNRPVYRIADKELLSFTVKHTERSNMISRLIREYGEVNLPELHDIIENGSTHVYHLTSEELFTHLDTLAQQPEVRDQMSTNYRYTKDRLKRDSTFLNRILPIVSQRTEDSRSLLLHLLEHKSSDEDIQSAIDTQPNLKCLTYKETAKVLESLKFYERNGLLGTSGSVISDPNQLLALHLITKAIVATTGVREINIGHGPLDMSAMFIDKDPVYFFKDKELLDLALNHPEHAKAIAHLITSTGVIHYPAIEFIINGGAKAISNGAL